MRGKAFEWTQEINEKFNAEKGKHLSWRSLARACGISPKTLYKANNLPYREKLEGAVLQNIERLRTKAVNKLEALLDSENEKVCIESVKLVMSMADRMDTKDNESEKEKRDIERDGALGIDFL